MSRSSRRTAVSMLLCTAVSGSTDYHCYCYDGFYGRNCTLYDPCFSAPCQNNGHCRNLSDTEYTCRCRPGFHGVNCQLYNPCADSPCLHGGMCNSIDGQFVCDCEPGYYGSVALSVISCIQTVLCIYSVGASQPVTYDVTECFNWWIRTAVNRQILLVPVTLLFV